MTELEKKNTHPRCPTCQVPMWFIKIERVDGEEMHHFECKVCDARSSYPAREKRV
jgi:hypothetical protein